MKTWTTWAVRHRSTRAPHAQGASLTPNQKGLVVIGAAITGVLLAQRWLRRRALGTAQLGPVTVTSTTYDEEDRRQELLSSQYRAALSMLAVDLDVMQPTRRPTPAQALLLEQTARNLDTARRPEDARFLREMLHEALELPLPGAVV